MSILTLRIVGEVGACPPEDFLYYSGLTTEVLIQIIDPCGCGYPLPSTGVTNLSVHIPAEGDELVLVSPEVSIETNRSVLRVALTAANTTAMISGFIRVEWDEGGAHKVAYADFIQSKVSSGY